MGLVQERSPKRELRVRRTGADGRSRVPDLGVGVCLEATAYSLCDLGSRAHEPEQPGVVSWTGASGEMFTAVRAALSVATHKKWQTPVEVQGGRLMCGSRPCPWVVWRSIAEECPGVLHHGVNFHQPCLLPPARVTP